jgi:hypothetical protein
MDNLLLENSEGITLKEFLEFVKPYAETHGDAVLGCNCEGLSFKFAEVESEDWVVLGW